MKDDFFDYYSPTPAQYEALWKSGIIVPDANVLLDLYRLPATAREELIQVLETLKDRLWIPHQVALEFQRNRLTVMSAERKATEGALTLADQLLSDLKAKVEALQLDKHGLDLQPTPLIENLEQANAKLIEAITKVHGTRPDIAAPDPVRERLDQILSGKVGGAPTNQADLDVLTDGGEQRYADRIPPGYADADKEKNPYQATFFHDQIRYQRKFGDLILWRQLINYAKGNGIKEVLLITADQKEDWWWREQGKTIGVKPDLVREIRKLGGVELFWMYSSVQFLEYAKTYVKANVSDQAIAELQEVSESPRRLFLTWEGLGSSPGFTRSATSDYVGQYLHQIDYRSIEKAVYEWLGEEHGEVIKTGEFPDFIVTKEDELHGYEVKYLRNFERMLFTPPIINSMLRGYLELSEQRLSSLTLVTVIGRGDFAAIKDGNKLNELRSRVDQILSKYPISGMVVGAVIGEHFEPLINHRAIGRS